MMLLWEKYCVFIATHQLVSQQYQQGQISFHCYTPKYMGMVADIFSQYLLHHSENLDMYCIGKLSWSSSPFLYKPTHFLTACLMLNSRLLLCTATNIKVTTSLFKASVVTSMSLLQHPFGLCISSK